MVARFAGKVPSILDFMGQRVFNRARSAGSVLPSLDVPLSPARPVEPPFGVGSTQEIFGPTTPYFPTQRIAEIPQTPFSIPPSTPRYEPAGNAPRATRVPNPELNPLLERLGVSPYAYPETSQYLNSPEARRVIVFDSRKVVGYTDSGDEVTKGRIWTQTAQPWLMSPDSRIRLIENMLRRGVDGRGRDLDRTMVPRIRPRTSDELRQAVARPGEEEVVPLRKILEDQLFNLRSVSTKTPGWWLKEQASGRGFDREFNALAVRDQGTGDRVRVELYDTDGNKFSIPTGKIDPEDPSQVFVFGSNLEGIHGAGAAKAAAELWGAQRGVGKGLTGRAYAFPTKRVPTSSQRQFEIFELENYFDEFAEVARANPDKKFMFTPVGTGLGGYDLDELAFIIARASKNGTLPSNIYFVDINETKTNEFISAIARARKSAPNEYVYIDVDELVDLEQRFFGSSVLLRSTPNVQRFDLPELPAPSILKYADPGTPMSPGTQQISEVVRAAVASGDEAQIAAVQALTLRRLQMARTPRAIVSAIKDYQVIAPTIKRSGVINLGFRDAIEVRMATLGVLNKKLSADAYVYLADEAFDAKKMAGYIENYVDEASTFEELLLATSWLDDTFVATKLSHPELLSRGEWSRTEERILNNVVRRIERLRDQRKKYQMPQGEDVIRIRGNMPEQQTREMFSEAIGTARSLDEMRLINAILNKLEITGTLREDLNAMMRSVLPLLSPRRIVPVRDPDLRGSRIKRLAASADPKAERQPPSFYEYAEQMAGDSPLYSDIIGWEEGARRVSYRPYKSEDLLRGATTEQKRWIVEQSSEFVANLRNSLDIDELREMYLIARGLKDTGGMSGRMWKYLEKEFTARGGVIKDYYKRTGITPRSAIDPEERDYSNVMEWARSQDSARRAATRYWNDPDIAGRDDLSDFAQFNPAYEELIHDANIMDAQRGRSPRAYADNDLYQDPFASFDDKLGEISILRGDISEEIIRSTNTRYWELTDNIASIEKTLESGVDGLGRNIDTEMVVRFIEKKGGKPKEVIMTLRESLEMRRAALLSSRKAAEIADAAWYNDTKSNFSFGTRRIVDPLNPEQSKIQLFDFDTMTWYDADMEAVVGRRSSNAAYQTKKGDFSEAIIPDADNFTLVYESAPREFVGPDGKKFSVRPLVRMFVPDGFGYEYRTFINAYGSDATVAVAADFKSGGEILTKRFANGSTLRFDFANTRYAAAPGVGKPTRYIAIPHQSDDFNSEVGRLVDQLNETYRLKNDTPITVNFAGNSHSTLGANSQGAADEYAYRLLRAAMEHPRRRFVIANARSGGQTGYDQAFMKALIRLDIPVDVTLPRAKFGNKVMVKGSDDRTAYVSIEEYLASVGFSRQPVASSFGPLREMVTETSLPGKGVSWGQAEGGPTAFEVSTKGTPEGRRYSAFNARIKAKGNKSIEDIYQVDIKGGEKLGPGKYSKKGSLYDGPLTYDELWSSYKGLWQEFFNENPDMLLEISRLTEGKMIVDRFASSDISQARAIFEILSENNMWRGLPGQVAAPRASSSLSSIPVSSDLPNPRNSNPWKMVFKDSSSMPMAPENRGKSTMELIAEGKRTATTRANNYNVKLGDVIDFVDDTGVVLRVRVTREPYQLPEATDAIRQRWSELEGWDPSVYDKYVGQWQFQYELLGRVK